MDVDCDPADDGGQPGIAGDGEPFEPGTLSSIGKETTASVSLHCDPDHSVGGSGQKWILDRLQAVLDVIADDRSKTDHSSADLLPTRISIRVTGDREMDAAHRRWSDVPGTTDVLTFESREDESLEIDLLLCRDEAVRRAEEFGHDIDRELLLYAVHGILHCLGHDDHEDEARTMMHREEDRLLAAVGVGAVYRPERAS
ncbi:MAG: rRNA maturation RNase YbeY [Planctomycetaceae bacterium]|nr:rRNA maturation RNase YbeY [Planctomycetaceae bacterium]